MIKRGVKPKDHFSGFGDRRKEMLEDIAILTGGGTALIRAAQKLEGVKPECYGCVVSLPSLMSQHR